MSAPRQKPSQQRSRSTPRKTYNWIGEHVSLLSLSGITLLSRESKELF